MPNDAQTYDWYQTLIKPDWAPPAEVFGPVWTVLYLIIAVSFGYALVQVARGRWPVSLRWPIVLNVIFNFAFTPLQFGLKSNVLAMIDIFLVLGTIIWLIVAIKPYSKAVALAQVPYLVWVSFATVLQVTVTYLNW